MPKVFDRIEVWRLSRPVHNPDVFLLEECCCKLRLVLWIIILLKYEIFVWIISGYCHLQVGFHHVDIVSGVHNTLDARYAPSTPSSETSPHHNLGRMLDGALQVLWIKPLAFTNPDSL